MHVRMSILYLLTAWSLSATQDIIINNILVVPGTQACAVQYDLIKNALHHYQRPITVLEIDAQQGFFSFKLAHDMHATCVMTSPDPGDQLQRLCALNTSLSSLILLKKSITVADLQLLSECEHIDVVLCLNFAETFGQSWRAALDVLMTLGENVIIQAFCEQTAQNNDQTRMINKELAQRGAVQLGNSHMWHVKTQKLYIHKPWWQAAEPLPLGDYFIESTDSAKIYHHFPTHTSAPWVPGIGLQTFLALQGAFPTAPLIAQALESLHLSFPYDAGSTTLVLQGSLIQPRIWYDKERHQRRAPASLRAYIHFFKSISLPLSPGTSMDNYLYHLPFMEEAIRLATHNVTQGGGPFGAVVVKDGHIIATGANNVTRGNDPTAHAEVVAIRNACAVLNSFQLTDCDVYSSCEPCPMCLGALLWARPRAVYFANTRHDAAAIGFDDSYIYEQVSLPPEARALPCHHLIMPQALHSFKTWTNNQAKIAY